MFDIYDRREVREGCSKPMVRRAAYNWPKVSKGHSMPNVGRRSKKDTPCQLKPHSARLKEAGEKRSLGILGTYYR